MILDYDSDGQHNHHSSTIRIYTSHVAQVINVALIISSIIIYGAKSAKLYI